MTGPQHSNRTDTILSYEEGTAVTIADTFFTADTSFPCYIIQSVRRGPVTYQQIQTKKVPTADTYSGPTLTNVGLCAHPMALCYSPLSFQCQTQSKI